MSHAITSRHQTGNEVAELTASVQNYLRSSAAPATIRAYRSDWACFEGWCQTMGAAALPAAPATVATFISSRADRQERAVTIERRLAAIAKAHKVAGLESPTRSTVVRETMKGIRRTLGTASTKKDALVTARLLTLLATTGTNLLGARDRAVLSVGFVAGLRRSEIAALDLEDIRFGVRGALMNLKRSKTDQEGAGRGVEIAATGLPTCPVAALRSWIEAAGIEGGPLFRELDRSGTRLQPGRMGAGAVARCVQRLAKKAGMGGDFGAHSLRSGFATSAIGAGVAREYVMRQGGWNSERIMRGYVRAAEEFSLNYSAALGL